MGPDRKKKTAKFILANPFHTTQLVYSMSKVEYGRGLILKDESISLTTQLEPISMTVVFFRFISVQYT